MSLPQDPDHQEQEARASVTASEAAAMPSSPQDWVEGTIQSLRSDQQGGRSVWQGLVVTDAQVSVPLHMRGRELLGIVEVGHRVRMLRPVGTESTSRLENLTTGHTVTAWNPPWRSRMAAVAGPAVAAAFIGQAFAAAIAALIRWAPGGPTNTHLSANIVLLWLLLASSGAAVIFAVLYIKPRRDRRAAMTSPKPEPEAPLLVRLVGDAVVVALLVVTALFSVGGAFLGYVALTRL